MSAKIPEDINFKLISLFKEKATDYLEVFVAEKKYKHHKSILLKSFSEDDLLAKRSPLIAEGFKILKGYEEQSNLKHDIFFNKNLSVISSILDKMSILQLNSLVNDLNKELMSEKDDLFIFKNLILDGPDRVEFKIKFLSVFEYLVMNKVLEARNEISEFVDIVSKLQNNNDNLNERLISFIDSCNEKKLKNCLDLIDGMKNNFYIDKNVEDKLRTVIQEKMSLLENKNNYSSLSLG